MRGQFWKFITENPDGTPLFGQPLFFPLLLLIVICNLTLRLLWLTYENSRIALFRAGDCPDGNPAQTPAAKPFAFLEATTITAVENRGSQWETDYGSFKRTQDRQRNVAIDLGNLSHAPFTYHLTVYFVA